MNLQNWLSNGWLKHHSTSKQEINNLLNIVNRDLHDAKESISLDWQFGIAYNAALKLCAILLYASGYMAENTLQHYRTIMAMPIILGDSKRLDAEYLNTCRTKRNIVEYDCAGGVTSQETVELVNFVSSFKQEVINWLKQNHPEYL